MLCTSCQHFARTRVCARSQDRRFRDECFVCGMSRQNFVANDLDFRKHTDEDHNEGMFVAFKIYLDQTHRSHQTSLEQCDSAPLPALPSRPRLPRSCQV